MSRPRTAVLGAIGVALFLAHAGLAVLLARAPTPPLEVEWNATDPLASRVVSGDADRLVREVDGQVHEVKGDAPTLSTGMRWVRWVERYRGGHTRAVGAAATVGPRQSPDAPPCGVRLRVSQRLLDDGRDEPGTVAHLVRAMLERELDGLSVWPLGAYQRIERLQLRWSRGGGEPRDVLGAVVEAPPAAFIALHLELAFERGRVPLFIALIPSLVDGALTVESRAQARVESNSRLYQLVIRLLSGDRRATEAAEDELATSMLSVLEAPPPLPLDGGASLHVAYCRDQPLRVVDNAYAELPLAVSLTHAGPGGALPLLFDLEPTRPDRIDGAIEVELDANALGALVHQLWAVGFLDRQLAAAGLEKRFNDDPDVRQLLTVRARDLALRGMPVIEPVGHGRFSLAGELDLMIEDGEERTAATLFARSRLEVATDGERLLAGSILEADLTCRPAPDRLRACYGTLVSELQRRAPEAASVVENRLETAFRDLLLSRRVTIEGAPSAFVINSVAGRGGENRLQIRIDGALASP